MTISYLEDYFNNHSRRSSEFAGLRPLLDVGKGVELESYGYITGHVIRSTSSQDGLMRREIMIQDRLWTQSALPTRNGNGGMDADADMDSKAKIVRYTATEYSQQHPGALT
jgi:hypothetical protein